VNPALERVLSAPVARAGAAAGAIRVLGRLVAFALQLLLARIIVDAAAFGVYAWGQNLLFLLGGLFALGLPAAAARLVAVHDHCGDVDAQRAVIARARAVMAACSAGFIALGVLLLQLLPSATGPSGGIALAALVGAPLVAFTLFHQAVARAQSQLVAAFLPTQVLRPALTAVLALAVLAATGAPLTALHALGAVAGSLALVLAGQWLATRPRRRGGGAAGDPPSAAPDPPEEYAPERLLGIALPIFATRVSELLARHSGVLVLGLVTTPALVGGFFVAERLAQLIALPMLVVAAVIQPWLASAFAAGDRERLQRVVIQAIHTALWPTLAGAIVVVLGADLLLGLFGEAFVGAAPVLLVLVLGHVAAALLGPNPQILVMTGHQAVAFRIAALAAGLQLVLLAVLVPGFGAVGAAWATFAGTTSAGAAALWAVRARLGLKSSVLVAGRA
jgi:O-antigen/teichoic acid export membrane protein